MGERGPNPRFSPSPSPNFGDGAGTGIRFGKILGNFSDEGRLNFEFFRGFTPENPQNIFGEILGTGISLTLGIFEFFSPKKLKFWGIPENPHSIDEYLGFSKMIGDQQGWPYKNQIVGVIYPYLPILNSS